MLGNNNNFSGNNGNNANTNKPYDPTVFSNYRFANFETPIGTISMRFSFWRQNLKITIVPMINRNGAWSYDDNSAIDIHLNHTKARMFAQEIRNFLRDSTAFNGCGVSTTSRDGNSSLITISDGSDYGIDNTLVIIRKIDPSGKIIADIAYPFRKDYFYGVRDVLSGSGATLSPDTMKTCTDDYNNIEIEELLKVLDTYADSMTNSMAYSVVDQAKWDFFRLSRKLDTICDSLGVSTTSASSGRSNGFFSRASSNNSYTNTTDSQSYDID